MLTLVKTPDWLKLHDGELRPSKDNHSVSVDIGGQLRYVLIPVPVKGKYACRISETINGRRLDGDATFSTAEEALRGGLEQLRNKLGW
jgi:hypothetical protein